LRREGVRVAIDDFGTGHSSLARLRDLPADTVKIDQSFVRELATDSTAMAITTSIVSLARRLGLEVIAEGIETAEQRDALLEIGCRYGQGFLLGFPFPAGEVVERFAVR
jgi:diguanylate cyclase